MSQVPGSKRINVTASVTNACCRRNAAKRYDLHAFIAQKSERGRSINSHGGVAWMVGVFFSMQLRLVYVKARLVSRHIAVFPVL